jgi:hypothetical protein
MWLSVRLYFNIKAFTASYTVTVCSMQSSYDSDSKTNLIKEVGTPQAPESSFEGQGTNVNENLEPAPHDPEDVKTPTTKKMDTPNSDEKIPEKVGESCVPAEDMKTPVTNKRKALENGESKKKTQKSAATCSHKGRRGN